MREGGCRHEWRYAATGGVASLTVHLLGCISFLLNLPLIDSSSISKSRSAFGGIWSAMRVARGGEVNHRGKEREGRRHGARTAGTGSPVAVVGAHLKDGPLAQTQLQNTRVPALANVHDGRVSRPQDAAATVVGLHAP